MSGLENMKRQILDEANHSAEEQISKARTKAEEILREAREQMEEQSAVMAKKSAEDIIANINESKMSKSEPVNFG